MEEIATKKCSACGEIKPKTEFKKGRCKECRCKYSHEYYLANKEIILENKKYREEKKEKIYKKVTCDCGCVVCLKSLQQHKLSQKHTNKINGATREPKKILTYYDEENNNKRVFIYVEPDVYNKFQKAIRYNKNNYKILKEMNII